MAFTKRRTSTGRCAALALLGATCAHPGAPVPFARSAAYHRISGSVVGMLERDLDAEGRREAVVARRGAGGFTLSVLRASGAGADTWAPVCDSPPLGGEELLHLAALG